LTETQLKDIVDFLSSIYLPVLQKSSDLAAQAREQKTAVVAKKKEDTANLKAETAGIEVDIE
jgi:hypothetical protein